jgi:retron-type reverse transcriptase
MIHVAYRKVLIPKKDGGHRTLYVPLKALKEKQGEILKYLTGLASPAGPYIHAYVKRRSIRTFASRFHTAAGKAPRYLLKVDIKDFFPSLTEKVVMKEAERRVLNPTVRDMIRRYCFVRTGSIRVLPQGAPTSPFLSNLVMKTVMARIGGLLKWWERRRHYGTVAAAYCDNIVIGGFEPGILGMLWSVKKILKDYGLELNEKKTRLVGPGGRKEVCGVVISEKLSTRKDYWRRLRAALHNAERDIRTGQVPPGFYFDPNTRTRAPIPWSEWRGKIAFVASLNPLRGAQLAAALARLEVLWTANSLSLRTALSGTSAKQP